ncbi:membrane protein [Novosphingobium chloroacetimidivorans]|uniref:Membrane protein n=1 Tax=Novosphingobium chloroacetimidivorans TaxID=1428314 RepID=A0A7W7NVV2_9SPHN|nr:HAD family hydrolase [Novosphingobium chloroacetimidivorans]MBB4857704.1 membrane protein [Novosphingobium chloroacetimidivorans]
MPIRAVLFDIDGTLVDSNDLHVLAWQRAFEQVGAAIDAQTIHDQIGKGKDMLVPALLPYADEATQGKAGELHGTIFKTEYLDRVEPFAGARDLLARVHEAGQQVVLASSASAPELEHYVQLLEAGDLVDASTSGDDVEHTKPAPDIFAAAMAKLAPLRPEEAIVVGDTPYDIEAAAKCEIAAVAVRSGKFSDAALTDAGAIAIYDDVAALLADYSSSPLGR